MDNSAAGQSYMPEAGFVRVDCDFAADGLWTRRGSSLTPEDLGLSSALCVALRAWQAHHDELAWQALAENPRFSFVAHERIGRMITALVAAERPDLHVVYAGDEPYPGDIDARRVTGCTFPTKPAIAP